LTKRKTIVGAVAVVALTASGFAFAGVVVTGDHNGTVTVGQALTISVSDSLSGNAPGGPPYGWCDPSAYAVASGSFTIGPLGPSEGGTPWTPLSVSCSDSGTYTGTWTYTGGIVVTVPPDAPTDLRVSVAVQEKVPVQLASDSGCDCYSKNDYSFNQSYTVVTASSTMPTSSGATTTSSSSTTSSSTTAPTTTGETTTTPAASTTTATTTATATTTTRTTPALRLGRTVLLHRRARTRLCRRGVLPDARCSPGAYYSGLTGKAICSPEFDTSQIPDVSGREKRRVEAEYGMPQKRYGRSIEIDRIVPLGLGGSNAIANLFPESGSGPASYHAKDRLERRLRSLVCSGRISLDSARKGIAKNWTALYRRVFGSQTAAQGPIPVGAFRRHGLPRLR
jgi:hypothetical protein